MTSPEDWLVCRVPRPDARLRLFCFPYAGVGASIYRRWGPALPADVEVWAIQSPGRENRIREPAFRSITALVDALVPVLEPHVTRPFAFFGHSMGAVVATEIARRYQASGRPGPTHLIVSGRRPPHVPPLDAPLVGLSDAELLDELARRYGGIPAPVRRDTGLMAQLLPCLRADIEAIEGHRPPPGAALACPITVFGGASDLLSPREHLDAWRAETTGAFAVQVFEGGHFFLEPRRIDVLAEIAKAL